MNQAVNQSNHTLRQSVKQSSNQSTCLRIPPIVEDVCDIFESILYTSLIGITDHFFISIKQMKVLPGEKLAFGTFIMASVLGFVFNCLKVPSGLGGTTSIARACMLTI